MYTNELTPKQLVGELNKYIIGQDKAKKSVAIAIRNRYRRLKLPTELRNEISPKNIIMIGPTGVGKTEIARRLAMILKAPFIKIEATKYTEIGYIGRNVEGMIKDLVYEAVNMIKKNREKEVIKIAKQKAKERVLNYLNPFAKIKPNKQHKKKGEEILDVKADDILETKVKGINLDAEEIMDANVEVIDDVKSNLLKELEAGKLDDNTIEIDASAVDNLPGLNSVGIISNVSDLEDLNLQLKETIDDIFSKKKNKTKKILVKKALKMFEQEEIDKLLDMDEIVEQALDLAQNSGIIFIDEIDKIIGKDSGSGPNVSREGVQRDILPIVEGTTVKTRFGIVKTDHILFIAAGAFHLNKPSDLIPELQGRFPIRVELNALKEKDLEQILVSPKNSLIKQYKALLGTEEINIVFLEDAILEIARFASEVNKKTDNIGARRLYALVEKLLEDISYDSEQYKNKTVSIDKKFVISKLADIVEDVDLSKYIL